MLRLYRLWLISVGFIRSFVVGSYCPKMVFRIRDRWWLSRVRMRVEYYGQYPIWANGRGFWVWLLVEELIFLVPVELGEYWRGICICICICYTGSAAGCWVHSGGVRSRSARVRAKSTPSGCVRGQPEVRTDTSGSAAEPRRTRVCPFNSRYTCTQAFKVILKGLPGRF